MQISNTVKGMQQDSGYDTRTTTRLVERRLKQTVPRDELLPIKRLAATSVDTHTRTHTISVTGNVSNQSCKSSACNVHNYPHDVVDW